MTRDALAAQTALLHDLHAEVDPDGRFGAIPRAPRDRPLPLSFAQRRLWLHDRMAVAGEGYTIPMNLRLEGALDIAALERALSAIVERHEALRAVFVDIDGEPAQRIAPARPIRLAVEDLSHLEPEAAQQAARARIDAANRAPFSLAEGPLLRAGLLRLSEADHYLLLAVHHIAFDGWSFGVFLAELSAFYRAFRRGRPLRLPPLDIQYADFAAWQAQAHSGPRAEAEIAHWRAALAGAPPVEIPSDKPRPAVLGARGGRVDFEVPAFAWRRYEALARAQGATPYMALLAAFAMLMRRMTGLTRATVGSPVAGRDNADVEGLIGFFVNSLVMAPDLSGAPSVAEAIARVRDVALDAFDHAGVPFERLVEEIQPERHLDRNPLFQVMIALQQSEIMAPTVDLDGLVVTPTPGSETTSRFDLEIHAWIEDGRLKGLCVYNRDLYERPTAERLLARLARLIESAGEDGARPVDALDYIGAGERAGLARWNDTAQASPNEPLHLALARRAAAAPEQLALVFGDRSLTLAALEARANRIARLLIARGVRRGDVVSLCLDRGDALIAAFLGVFKAGACYLPVDPAEPADRFRWILEDSRAALHLTETRHAGLFSAAPPLPDGTAAPLIALDREEDALAALPAQAPGIVVGPDDLAYIIYTSGSTGRPKGIEGRHGTIANLVEWHLRHHPGPPLRTLQYAQVSFDIFFQELFTAWLAGGACYMVDEAARRDMHALAAFIRAHRLERIFLPFAPLQYLIDVLAEADLPDLRQVFTAGEQLQATPQVVGWFAQRPGVTFHNHYGPTECYVVGAHDLPADPQTWPALPPVGLPVDNVRLHIVDRGLRELPVGVEGEILIGGAQLSRGYRRRPDLTAEKFIPDPFSPTPGARAYRTGDLGVRQADGAIRFLGRMDRQLKIRGFRVEPGEIEVALARHPAVAQALVTTFRAEAGDLRLVAYVVPRPGLTAAGRADLPRGLRAELDGALPENMIPAAFAILDALPMTVAGKIDRLALPSPDAAVAAPATATGASGPAGPVEAAVAEMFADLLGRDRVGRDEDFFELGGHSLLGSRLVSRLRATLGVETPLSRLFETPTVAGLAAHVEAARAAGDRADTIAATGRAEGPASFAQRRLWLMDRMGASGAAYLMPLNLALRGRLDVAALARALTRIVERHATLRTVFVERDGEVRQIALPPAAFALPIGDLADLPPAEREAALAALVTETGTRPFDLSRDPPFRARLARLGAEDWRLLSCFHHIAQDGWSIAVFFAELGAAYDAAAAGRADPTPTPALGYVDFAIWQHQALAGARRARMLAYWRPLLEGLAPLRLPSDRPRRAAGRFHGDGFRFSLPADLTAALRALARKSGATLYMTLLAGYMALLHRLSGDDRIAVGSPVANRTRGETESVIGFFVNMLVMTAEVDPAAPWSTLLAQVRARVLGAFDHQDMPFEALVEELRPTRDATRNPLFQVHFALQQPEAMASRPQLAGLEVEPLELGAVTARFDLETHMWLDGAELQGLSTFDADLFDRATVEDFIARFGHLLRSLAENPDRAIGELALTSEAERAALAAAAREPLPRFARGAIHARVLARCAATPEAIAVIDRDGRWSYRELVAAAGRVADRLAARGLTPGDRVIALTGRDRGAVAALLGVLMAGGCYVPLDPRYPAGRLAFVAGDCAARFALVDATTAGLLATDGLAVLRLDEDEAASAAPRPDVDEEATAYVIYTSGSTGRPKGVAVSHANVTRLLSATEAEFGFHPGDVWSCAHSLAFDFSVWEVWGALASGGRLVMADAATMRDPEAMVDLLLAEGVSVLNQTPSAFMALAPALLARPLATAGQLRAVIFGGEALDVAALAPWFDRFGDETPRLWNCYGITETTVHVTLRRLSRADCEGAVASPIGRAIPDLSLRLLDRALQPAPVNVVAELCVAGAGVAKGYLGRPDLDAERFVADPFGGAGRMYRSGDLARRRRDGEIEYLGRNDAQVKLRGHRIEPAEIAAALRADARVGEAAALLRAAPGDDPRLVAWVTPPRRPVEAGAEADRAAQWRAVFDERYAEADAVSDDPRLKLSGWTSAYDRTPIARETMRAWADGAARQILALRPRRILEIGCGTGMLLFRLAPHVDRFLGVDPSQVALDHVRATIDDAARDCAHAETRLMAADEIDALAGERFDTIVVNSVVQYLPGPDYLIRMLAAALRLLAPGGRIYVGDLRDARLVEAFHIDALVERGDSDVATLPADLARALAQENELVVAPDFFRALPGRLPGIGAVGLRAQDGAANELTTFRYAAVLEAGPVVADSAAPRVVEAGGCDLEALDALLAEVAEATLLRGIVNARPARALARAAALAAGGDVFAAPPASGVDPQALAERAARRGLDMTIAPDPADPGRFDALATRAAAPACLRATPIAADPLRFVNDPLGLSRLAGAVEDIRLALASRLPDYMRPAHLVVVPALPLTVNGKLDARALPDPWRAVGADREAPTREPATATETALAEMFAALLGRDRIGVDADFFALGGHSLLAVSLSSRVRERFGVELPLLRVFQSPTVAALAEVVDTLLWAGRAETQTLADDLEQGEI